MTAATQTLSGLPAAKPFLKWAGGKTQLLPSLLPLIPDSFDRYLEPFVGAGALFFALDHRPAVLSDANRELILTYEVVRDDIDGLLDALHTFENTSEAFYRVREWLPEELSLRMRAARLIYLNKTCFNGLYRVNKQGKFNTPYNGGEGIEFVQEDVLRKASEALRGVSVLPGDYHEILKSNAQKDDFIFLDPPYRPVGKYSDFKRYTKERFHDNDQEELAAEFRRLVDLGCKVILTNSAHDSILELYKGYDLKVVDSKRLISSDIRTRNGQDLIVRGGF